MANIGSPSEALSLTWLVKEWASRLALSLESMTGSAPAVSTGDSPGLSSFDAVDGAVLWRQPFEPLQDATLWVGAGQPVWSTIGLAVLSAAGVEQAGDRDVRGTYLEVIGQALSGMAQAFAGLTRSDIRCGAGSEEVVAPAISFVPVNVQMPGGSSLPLVIGFSAGIMNLTSRGPLRASIAGPTPLQPEEPDTHRTIDLLYEVELPVSVSFGRAHLPLKEVLKLTSGSIVELNRAISEPVEVIVNNCVIARGEVVVVEGNYGVRITQILSRRDRLRTLY